MNILDRIKAMKGSLVQWDGSIDVAKQYEDWIRAEADMKSLLATDGWKRLQEQLIQDLHAGLKKAISADPELTAIKRMLVRTLGTQGAQEAVTKIVDEIAQETGF